MYFRTSNYILLPQHAVFRSHFLRWLRLRLLIHSSSIKERKHSNTITKKALKRRQSRWTNVKRCFPCTSRLEILAFCNTLQVCCCCLSSYPANSFVTEIQSFRLSTSWTANLLGLSSSLWCVTIHNIFIHKRFQTVEKLSRKCSLYDRGVIFRQGQAKVYF